MKGPHRAVLVTAGAFLLGLGCIESAGQEADGRADAIHGSLLHRLQHLCDTAPGSIGAPVHPGMQDGAGMAQDAGHRVEAWASPVQDVGDLPVARGQEASGRAYIGF